ncbi:MAG: cyclase family protein [Acidobacteria bacterium]|nr:cyclase family protein [Acidobacteriota bacterium]
MMSSLSNWGRWGPQDQMGAVNLITPQKQRQAAALVKEGMSVSLAHDAVKVKVGDSPAFEQKMLLTGQRDTAMASMDAYSVAYHGYTQTHLDALCHLFYKGKMYNGFSQKEVAETGAAKLSVIQFKNGIFTRGVLMDLPRLQGVKYLRGATAIYPEDLEAWEKTAGTRVEAGDAIFIRTGRWARQEAEGAWNFESNSAGLHASCLPWLKKRDVAILGSDLATDVMPSGVNGFRLPIHLVTIAAMGVPIFDNCDLEALGEAAAARRRWDFLLTAAPLAVEGGTGSPINPTATF